MLTPEEIAHRKTLLDHTAQLVKNGTTYRIDIDALQDYQWSDSFDSSWFRVAMIGLARQQLRGPLSRREVLQLVADLLHTTADSLEETMDWNANYMAWHDGGSVYECHVWPNDEGAAHDQGAIPPAGTPSTSLPQ